MDTDQHNKTSGASGNEDAAGEEFHSHYRRLWWYSITFAAFVSLTPLVIMTFMNYCQYKETITAEMIHPISRLVSNSRRFMDAFLEEHRAALVYVAGRESYEDLRDPKTLGRILLDMQESFGGFVDLGVIDEDGNQVSYVGRYELEGKNYKEQDWFQEVRVKGDGMN